MADQELEEDRKAHEAQEKQKNRIFLGFAAVFVFVALARTFGWLDWIFPLAARLAVLFWNIL
jgi:hypothetical protein